MPVYVFGKLIVGHWDWYREYRSTTEPLVAQHGGRYLIKGGPSEKLEGDEPVGHAQVLIEFPDREAALNWYRDPAYARMIALRKKSGVITELTMIEGIPPAD
ncbi:DUF1330 domain-containing protein [Sphingomonas sp. KC8]|uniref:DUF1330 domain-containing protein n=1 Tax=Sphingomonas sp. KC8 TaxID=1030157 RepID=UPI000248862C|nr:DUF1330 domain-containing protein [Sphingomonas sp. KC8]ARS29475.1 hypothetical protein KC8_19590 [Sphingomonas sp. KC8]